MAAGALALAERDPSLAAQFVQRAIEKVPRAAAPSARGVVRAEPGLNCHPPRRATFRLARWFHPW